MKPTQTLNAATKRLIKIFGMLFAAAICLLFAYQPISAKAQPAETYVAQARKAATAADLLRAADKGVGYLVKTARESKDPALSPGTKTAKPFWQAVRKLNEAIDKAGRGLQLRDATFHRSLGNAVSAVNEVSVALSFTGAKNTAVEGALRKVETAVTLLHENYGKAAARRAQGGSLTDQEKKQLAQMRRKQAELETKLQSVEKKARRNSNAIRGIRRIREQSDRIARSRDTVGDFLSALLIWRAVDGLLWGSHWWWGPWGTWIAPFSAGVVDIYYESISVIDYDWDLVETPLPVDDYDLEVAIDDAEIEALDDYLETSDFAITNDDIAGISDDQFLETAPMPAEPERETEGAPMPVEPGLEADTAPMPAEPERETEGAPMPVEPGLEADTAPMPVEPGLEADTAPMPAEPEPEAEMAPMPAEPEPIPLEPEPEFGREDFGAGDFGGDDFGGMDLDLGSDFD